MRNGRIENARRETKNVGLAAILVLREDYLRYVAQNDGNFRTLGLPAYAMPYRPLTKASGLKMVHITNPGAEVAGPATS